VIRGGTFALGLAALVLFVIWYFVGGRQEIQWHLAVHRAAKSGWDISQADRYPEYGLLYFISLPLGLILFVSGMVNLVIDATRKMRKAMDEPASKAN
jgi:hypothetical protein